MIPQAQIPQYNARANAMMGQVAQGIGQLGQAYQDRGFRQDMGGVQSSKDLLELYATHPDKYDPNRVKQMQQQEAETLENDFMEKIGAAENQTDALNLVKSNPSLYNKKVDQFISALPSPKRDAIRKEFLEEGAYVNTGKFDLLPALFDKREAKIEASDLPPEEKQERLDDIADDREALADGNEVYAERHRLSEEGVLGADNFKKMMEARREQNLGKEVSKDSIVARNKMIADAKAIEGEAFRAAEMAETEKLAKQAATAKILADIGLDAEKMSQLPAGTSKKIETLTDEIGEEDLKSADIKNIISEAGVTVDGSGTVSIIGDKIDTVIGDRDALAKLRTKFNKIINIGVMNSLPPGAASENDVAIARQGFPPAEAGKDEIVAYLEAAGRISVAKSRYKSMRIKFLSENFTEGKARKDFAIDGKPVKKGETFIDFAKRTRNDLDTATTNTDKPKSPKKQGGPMPNANASAPAGSVEDIDSFLDTL